MTAAGQDGCPSGVSTSYEGLGFIPRPYQIQAVNEVRSLVQQGYRTILLQAATGSGKTAAACMVMAASVSRGKRVLFLAHTRELVYQCHRKLAECGIDSGIIMAGESNRTWLPVQVASKDTLLSRAVTRQKMEPPPADVVIQDECHRAISPGNLKLAGLYPNAVFLGLTATPARGDGRGLGQFYERMVMACSTQKLIDDGYLVPSRVFAPHRPDLEGVKTSGGDYVAGELQKRMNQSVLVGDVVDKFAALADRRQAIVFASGVLHSVALRDQFVEEGFRAAHIDGETPLDERDEVFKRFVSGEIQIICNCLVCIEGVDLPCCSCIVMARPTKSIIVHKQQLGRGMRPAEGKKDMLVIDHAGNVYRHGLPHEDVDWSLDPDDRLQDRIARKREAEKREPTICKKCFCAYIQQGFCPNCGADSPKRKHRVKTKDGQLIEVGEGGKPSIPEEMEQITRFWRYCLFKTAGMNQTLRVAAGMFVSQYKKPPWEYGVTPIPPPGEGLWQQKTADVFPNFRRSK